HLLSTLRQTFLKSDLHSRLQAPPETPGTEETARPAEELTGTQRVASERFSLSAPNVSSLSNFELGAGADDRQMVASWCGRRGGRGAGRRYRIRWGRCRGGRGHNRCRFRWNLELPILLMSSRKPLPIRVRP